jgi:hypothetical protein
MDIKRNEQITRIVVNVRSYIKIEYLVTRYKILWKFVTGYKLHLQ